MKKLFLGIALVLIVGFIAWQFKEHPLLAPILGTSSMDHPLNKVAYVCDQGKTISATFYTEKVTVILGDGRKLTLSQAPAASGIRYTNKEDTFVFWSKGNTAFITEGKVEPQDTTYQNCITSSSASEVDGWNTYASSTMHVSVKYPQDYTLNASYTYQGLVNRTIGGAKFTVAPAMATGTNLSSDSGVSIESLPTVPLCSASAFLYGTPASTLITEGDMQYSFASSSDAGAGNRYEEMVYVIPNTSPCVAIRYFIHSSAIENYPPGEVTAYDRALLLTQFDTIRRSLTIGR